MNKIIRVDMTRQKVREEKAAESASLFAGRALIDKVLNEEVNPAAHPLSFENKLIIAPGFFAATPIPNSGRLSVGGKSPLTYGVKEANSGGPVASKIVRLGIKGIIVEGQAQEGTYVMHVTKDSITLKRADDLRMLGNYETCRRLRGEYGDAAICSIGPCGEMKMSSATVAVSDTEGAPTRHSARGGLGAVMGSKGLKAIVVDDRGGSNQKPVNGKAFKEAVQEAVQIIQENPRIRFFRAQGTAGLIPIDNARGSLPTRNHRFGSFDKYEGLTWDRMSELQKDRGGSNGHACMPGCIVKCSNTYFNDKKEYVTAGFEYETLAMLGANLEIDDIDAVAMMDRKCDDYGVDTIETGATIGLLGETGLFEFGDTARALSLLDEIGSCTVLGRILGQGIVTTARVFGISRIPAVKGQAIPAHSARSMKGLGVTYATSPQGADHTAGFVAEELLSSENQAPRSLNAQLNMVLMDSSGLCYFTLLMGNHDLFAKLINGLYGLDYDKEELLAFAKKVLKLELNFNRGAGITREHDRLPKFMEEEKLAPTNAVFNVPLKDLTSIFDDI